MHLDGKIFVVACESAKSAKISLLQNFALYRECSCTANVMQTNRQTDRHTHTHFPHKNNLYKACVHPPVPSIYVV